MDAARVVWSAHRSTLTRIGFRNSYRHPNLPDNPDKRANGRFFDRSCETPILEPLNLSMSNDIDGKPRSPLSLGKRLITVSLTLLLASCINTHPPKMKLSIWDRGIKVSSPDDAGLYAYLWFYEWHMFDAVRTGEHTGGTSDWQWTLNADGDAAESRSDWFQVTATAQDDGAALQLKVTNTTDREWPDIAAIIPCFNPGYDGPGRTNAVANPRFFDDGHDHTYFMGESGLDLLAGEAPREIHFNESMIANIDAWEKERDDGQFIWYHKWPTSKRNAHAGLLVRESEDRTQIMAIVWEDFISAQGHNPWKCMHLSARVGPLKPGQSKTLRGRIYLFPGSKDDFLAKLNRDFPSLSPR